MKRDAAFKSTVSRNRAARRKKAAPERAAKFREETPRMGSGTTREGHAALQQYARAGRERQERQKEKRPLNLWKN
jgi:hypothetical protein